MVKSIIRLLQPEKIFLGALTYSLGAGIAKYLGHNIQPVTFLVGMVAVLAVMAATTLFNEYFQFPFLPNITGATSRNQVRFRAILLQISYANLVVAAVCILILVIRFNFPISFYLMNIIAFLYFLSYSIPPFRLSKSGYGELVAAIYIGTILPVYSFLIQTGEFHRLLFFVTFPLTLLALAYLLVGNFSTFAADLKMGHNSLLHRMTWRWAVPFHQVLLLMAYLIFAVGPFVDIPWGVIWPVFLVLPFGIIQMVLLQQVAAGGRPIWKLLTNLAASTFGLTSYLLSLTFWIR